MINYPFLIERSTDRWFLDEYARLLPNTSKTNESPFRQVAKKFVIGFTPRVGSTLLCQNLFDYGVCAAEFFNPLHLSAETHLPKTSGSAELCEKLVKRYAVNGIWGVKAHVKSLIPLFEVGEFPAHLSEWRFVYLTRTNEVRQAISNVIAEIRQSWSSWTEVTREVTNADYSHAAIAQTIRSNELSQSSWEAFFAQYGIAPLRVTYEQIVADPAAAAACVAAYCGLELGGAALLEPFGDPPLELQTTGLNMTWEDRFRQEVLAGA